MNAKIVRQTHVGDVSDMFSVQFELAALIIKAELAIEGRKN
jgi:hypothetical protein